MADCAVACGVNVVDGGFLGEVADYAALYLAACFGNKLGVRAYAHRDYNHVEINCSAVLQLCGVLAELVNGGPENELCSLALDVLLHDGACTDVQNRRQDTVSHIDYSDVRLVLVERLGCLQTDKSRADYQYLHSGLDLSLDSLYAVVAHESVAGGYLLHSVHRGNERLRACSHHQLVVGDRTSVRKNDILRSRVYLSHAGIEPGLNAVLLVEVRAAVVYVLVCDFPHQPVGDERAGIGVVLFVGDNGYLSGLVYLTDTLDRSDCRSRVADNYVVHIRHLTFPRKL